MDFALTILGTASALPTRDRFASAQVLSVHGRLFLIDCAEGTQIQLRRAGVSYLKIEAICISHIHGDHCFGIFGLLSTMAMLGRTGTLHIFAPKAFGGLLKFFLSYYGEGVNYEIEHHVLEMKAPEEVYQTKGASLIAFPLRHKIDCYGFLFREKEPQLNVRKLQIASFGLSLAEIATAKRGEDIVREDGTLIKNEVVAYRPYRPRSYAYCSDTMPFPELAAWINGVDLLYHEATYPQEMAAKAAERFHSTALQAAQCAVDASAGRLLIGHFSSKYPDLSIFLDEARSLFPQTEMAKELQTWDIPLKKLE